MAKRDNKPVTSARLSALDAQMAELIQYKIGNTIRETDYDLLTTSALTRNLISHYNSVVARLLKSVINDATNNAKYILRETKKDVD